MWRAWASWKGTGPGREERCKCATMPATRCVCIIPGTRPHRSGGSAKFLRCELLTTRGECNASLLGHRSRSCALCWHRVGSAGECSPEISRLVHTGGKGRTSGCLLLLAHSGHGSRAHICAATFGRHECTTPSLRLFSKARTTIFATFPALFLLDRRAPVNS